MMDHRTRKLRDFWAKAALALGLLLALCSGWRDCAAETVSRRRVQLYSFSQVSPEFLQRAYAAAGAIPAPVWRALDRAGWKACVAEFVVDAAPSLRGVHPRGWPAGTTWENTDAVHLPQRRVIVFAEKRIDAHGSAVATTRLDGTLRHEVGHAFDMALGGGECFSAQAAFLAAYRSDLRRVGAADRKRLAYFLQGGPAGRQETFAEAFAVLLGGGSDAARRRPFVRAFPRVLALLKKSLDEREPSVAAR